jgi:hypothetical protein
MGYIPWSKFPRHFTPFTVTTNSNARTVTFNNLCVGKNIPWFYAFWGGTYANNVRLMEIFTPDTPGSASTLWTNVRVYDGSYQQGNTGHHLINRMQIIKLTQGGQYRFGYFSFKVNLAGQVSDIFYKDNNVLNFTQLKDFFEGGSALTLEIQGGSTVDVHASDITDKGTLIYHGSDYKIVFLTSGFLLPANMMEGGEYNNCNLSVGFRLPVPNETGGNAFTAYYIPNGLCTNANEPHIELNENYQLSDYYYQSCVQIYGTNYFFGGLHGEFSFDDFPPFPDYNQPPNYKWNDENELLLTADAAGTRKSVDIRWSAPWRACYDFILMLNKHAENSNSKPPYSNTYSTEYPVSMFTSTDTPTGESVGEPYNRVEPKLREWQKAGKSISDDDFDVDNMPEDEPTPDPRPEPEPPDKDTENGGDDIELPDTTGLGGGFMFTTQYALRGSQLTELGSKLWGFDVQDYYKNFIYSVDPDTGSVKMEDVFNFFISLRAYPFPIGNYASPAGTNMYIGSGTVPITFTSNIHVADTYLITIDAGKLSLPFWYNDFRDYQTTITLYLPYCGTAELNPADVMGGTLYAVYSVDLSTGACTAYVTCDTWDGKKTVVAILDGQMGADIPLTASNAGRVAARVMSDKINFAENIIGGLKSAAAGIGGVMSGNWAGAIQQGFNVFFGTSLNNEKQLAGMGERGAIAAPMLAGGRGLAAFKNPATVYLQVRGAIYPDVENYAASVGDPAAKTVRVGDCDGFCQFVNVNTDGIITDAADAAAIRDALAAGIYIN